jgi:hypothetical protein
LDHPEIPEEELVKPKAFVQNPGWKEAVKPDDKFVATAFRFTFVRDPIERFCSFHRSKIAKPEIKPHFVELGFRAGMTIDETVNVAEKVPAGHWDRHFAPQTFYVFEPGGKSRVELVGRLEDMGSTLDQIEARTGVRLWTPRLNVTSKGEPVPARSKLTPGTILRLEKLYAADFTAFGYPLFSGKDA